MKKGMSFILLFILLISISFIFASFSVGDKSHEITTIYGPGNNLEGWINLSLKKEPVSSLFKGKYNSIKLIDLLRSDTSLTEGIDYNCSVPGCEMAYSATGAGVTLKTFSLDSGESKVIGFKISDEKIDYVNNISFDIRSNAGPDCKNQLEIDFLIDEEIELGNNKNSIWDCPHLREEGCFNLSKYEDIDRGIPGGGSMFCQKIELSESPGFKLGAWLKIGPGAKKTNITIYNLGLTEKLSECEIADNSETPEEGEERSCDVDFLVLESKEYYVCIFNGVGTDLNTKIRSYSDSTEGCGFPYPESRVEGYAYNIFAEGKMFASVGVINIEDELGVEASQYISNEYKGGFCPTSGCIVPIKITSNKANQEIVIENISFEYDSGGTVEITKLWDLNLTSATVSTSGYQKISLNNGNFTLPTKFGSFIYNLKLDDKSIFKDTLLIERGPTIKSLSPSSAFNKIPINFRVNVQEIDNASIVSYVWQFGNAAPQSRTTNIISYTFLTEGIFPVKITVTDSKGKTGSKTFQVRVDSYILYFGSRVEKVKDDLVNIESQISNFSSFFQEGIKKTIDTPIIRQQLTILEQGYGRGEYDSVINEFLILESHVPESIFEKIDTSSLSYYPNIDYIESGIVEEVLGGSYDTTKTSAYKDAILTWSTLNIDSNVKYNQIAASYEDGRIEPILNVFELDLRKIGAESGTLFIRELENIEFDRAYGEQFKSGYVYIPLDSGKKVKFYTTQDVGITNLPAFISPALNELTIIEEYDEAEAARMRWLLFFLIMFFLLIVGIIVYIILQQWYKHKYETYLFKNRNFLFNLIHYIDAQKKKGVRDNEIFSKLKKARWNSEQINYVIRKYLGKRTGMLEIPIEKILRMFRKREIQQTGVPSAPGVIGPKSQRFKPGP